MAFRLTRGLSRPGHRAGVDISAVTASLPGPMSVQVLHVQGRAPHLPRLLRRPRARGGRQLVPGARPTTPPCCSPTRAWTSSRTSSPARPARAIRRATSSQKCVRAGGKHNDLENVGRTARHHTFFEMLGNFSFGDYFKEEAIAFACELLTREYGIDPEAAGLHRPRDRRRGARRCGARSPAWPTSRIIGLGDKDNFWAMGDTGPCGPCSEIHYHQGDDIPCAEVAAGRTCLGPACDCDRWIEIWNLVFMQFEQLPDRDPAPPAPPLGRHRHGARAAVRGAAGVRSNYETDLLRPLIDEAAAPGRQDASCPTDYSAGSTSVSLRAIADHARAAAFLIADGVFPEKTGREYVLRRIMRRAIYHGWLLGIRKPFLAGLAGGWWRRWATCTPSCASAGASSEVIDRRSAASATPWIAGVRLFEEEARQLRRARRAGRAGLPPVRHLRLSAGPDPGGGRGRAGWRSTRPASTPRWTSSAGAASSPARARRRSRRCSRASPTGWAPRTFLGYEVTEADSEIVALVAGGASVDAVTGPAPGRSAW